MWSKKINRRDLLILGGLVPMGLSLPQLLARGSKRSLKPSRAKSCLLIFMEGGPSHIDLWDMKPSAPVDVRGEFKPIATRVPGLHVCEHLPLFAQQIQRLSLVRSVHHTITDHNAGSYYMLTGHSPVDGGRLIVSDGPKNFPPFGSVIAKFRPVANAIPPFMHIPEIMSNNSFDIPGQSAGFLGAAFDPLVTEDPSLPNYQVPGMTPFSGLDESRRDERDTLRTQLDRAMQHKIDDPAWDRMDTFRRQALRMLASPAVRKAFDLSQEPLKVRERYGVDPGSDRAIEARKFGGMPHIGQSFLLARRLLEAGTRLITLVTGRRIDQAWDTHRDHFPLLKKSLLPPFDQACSALLEDLSNRGMLEETLVVIMGEFGRTPKLGYITSNAGAAKNGRDHWPFCYTVFLGGAGLPEGAIIGASDRIGANPAKDPVRPEDVAATIYSIMGIPLDTEIHDPQNRPYALITGSPIKGLAGD